MSFGLVAFDVFGDSSLHLLSSMDTYGHSVALTQTDPQIKLWLWQRFVSDFAYLAGMAGWLVASCTLIFGERKLEPKVALILGVSFLFYLSLVGG